MSLLAANTTAALAGRSQLLAQPHPAPAHQPDHNARGASGWILIGTHDGQGIYRARWDAHAGTIGAVELAVPTPQPTFLTRHPHLPVLYACNEADLPSAALSAFALDAATGTLHPLATQPTHGAAPCFASVDLSGQLAFTANYTGGSLTTFPLDAKGVPAPAAKTFTCATEGGCGTLGPVKDRQDSPHLHCCNLSPDHHFVLACDLGDDSLLVFPIHPGKTPPVATPLRLTARPGSGPRHLAFHPNGKWLYCIHELDCTVGLLHWHADHPEKTTFVPEAYVSILPPNHPREGSTGAEIAITRDGRFAYTSTRGADLLTLFAIDASDGRLQQLQQLPCGGKTPRFFALDPTERFLVCAHQDSNTLTVFARDTATGALTPQATTEAPNPECLLWV